MSEQIAVYRPRRLPLAGVVTAPSTKPRGGSSQYRRGSRAERELLREFQATGLLAVRSASSHGPFDLWVALPGGGRLLQCKCCTGEPSEAAVARWLAALPAVPAGWSSELWVKAAGHGWRNYSGYDDAGTGAPRQSQSAPRSQFVGGTDAN